MDAVPVEPRCSLDAWLTRWASEPAEQADGLCASHIVPACSEGEDRPDNLITLSAAEHAFRLWVVRSGRRRLRPSQLVDLAVELKQTSESRAWLADHTDGEPLTLRLSRKLESTVWWPRPDIVEPDSLTECPSLRASLSAAAPDEFSAMVAAPAASTVDAEVSNHWQALPVYTSRPFAGRACCSTSALTPEVVAAAQDRMAAARGPEVIVQAGAHEAIAAMSRRPNVDVAQGAGKTELFLQLLQMQLWQAAAPKTVTIRDKKVARDYREGLRRFLDGVMVLQRLMIVEVLAALSHVARTPAFLLVVLGSIRHYGRRGESDGHFMSAPFRRLIKPRGVACLAT